MFKSPVTSGVAVKIPNLFKLVIVVNAPQYWKALANVVNDVVCVVGSVIVLTDVQYWKADAKVVVVAATVAGSVIDVIL